VLACIWEFAQDFIDDYFTEAFACGEVRSQFDDINPDATPCGKNGLTFPSNSYTGYQPSSDVEKIASCIFSKAKEMTIEQILKTVKAPVENKLLSELLDGATETGKPDAKFRGLLTFAHSRLRTL